MAEKQNQAERKQMKRRWGRWVLIVLAVVVVALVGVVMLLPTMASTGPGRRATLSLINGRIPGTVEAQRISLAWFGGQQVSGFTLLDPNGERVVFAEELALPGASLWSLAMGSRELGDLRGRSIDADVVAYEDGSTNLSRSLAQAEGAGTQGGRGDGSGDREEEEGGAAEGLSFNLDLADVKVTYTPVGREAVAVEVAKATLDFADPRHIVVDVDATVRQGELAGSVTAAAKVDDLYDARGRMQLNEAKIDAAGQVAGLPLAAVDQLMGTGERAQAMVGRELNAEFTAQGTVGELQASVRAQSEYLNVQGELRQTAEGLVAEQGRLVQWTLTPGGWAAMRGGAGGAVSQLVEPATLVVEVQRLLVPKRDGALQWAQAAGGLAVSLSDMRLEVPEVGRVALTGTRGVVTGEPLGKAVKAELSSTAMVNDQLGEIRFAADVSNVMTEEGGFNAEGYSAVIDASTRQAPVMVVLDQLVRMKPEGLSTLALGPTADATLHAELAPAADGSGLAGSFTSRFESAHARGDLSGTISPEWIEVKEGSTLAYELRPEVVSAVMRGEAGEGAEEAGMTLASPSAVMLRIDRLTIPRGEMNVGEITAGLTATVDQMTPRGGVVDGVVLRRLAVHLPTVALKETAELQTDGELVYGQQVAQVDATTQVNLVDDEGSVSPRVVKSDIAVNELPVELVDEIGGQEGRITALLGATVRRVSMQVTGDPRESATFAARAESEVLTSSLAGQMTRTEEAMTVSLVEPSYAELKVTPETYEAFLEAGGTIGEGQPLRLSEPGTLRVDIGRAQLRLKRAPAAGEGAFDPSGFTLAAKATSPLAAFARADGFAVRVRDLSADVATEDLRGATTLKMRAGIEYPQEAAAGEAAAQPAEAREGELTSDTTITGLYGESGMQMAAATIETRSNARRFPSAVLDGLMGTGDQFEAALGPVVGAKVVGHYPGDLDVKLASKTADLTALVTVSEDRQVTLRENLQGSLTVTRKLSRSMLGKMQPIFADAVASRQPIELTVQKEGFVAPLMPFDIRKAQMKGTLNLGTLRMSRQGWFAQGLEGLLGDVGKLVGRAVATDQQGKAETYLAEFTPLEFVLDSGKLTTSEMWMTSRDLAVGFQGNAELPDGAIDFTTGLLGVSLVAQVPALRDVVEAGRVYELPLTGTLGGTPKLDYGPVLAELAASGVTRQVGGDVGAILGAVGELTRGRRGENRLTWSPPEAALELVETVQGRGAARTQPAERGGAEKEGAGGTQPAEQDPLRRILESIK
jgi:hypothetical protein